jgi:hypothetical protein
MQLKPGPIGLAYETDSGIKGTVVDFVQHGPYLNGPATLILKANAREIRVPFWSSVARRSRNGLRISGIIKNWMALNPAR